MRPTRHLVSAEQTGTRPTTRAARLAGPVTVALLAAAFCTTAVVGVGAQERGHDAEGGLLVLAAASLTDALPLVASRWSAVEQAPVRFSFGATSRLAPQATASDRADVFVAADARWMRWLEEEGSVVPGEARVVATNGLVVVVPADRDPPNDAGELARLARIALGGSNVPAGRYAREALERAGVWSSIASRVVDGGSVRGVLEWVARGEVDAGVVYRTDAIVEPDVEIAFAFSPGSHEPIRYWAAPLASSPDRARAARFVDFLGSPAASDLLAGSGFGPPDVASGPATDGAAADPTAGDDPDGPAVDPRLPPDGPTVDAFLPPDSSAVDASLPSVGSAVRLSLMVALFATLLGLAPAIGLGWLLARKDFRGKALVSTAVLAPLVLPPVVTGFLLLTLLGSNGLLGGTLSALGMSVPFTLAGAIIAALVVGMPLYVLSIRGAFEAIDPVYEELSWTLGVPPRTTFLRISLPLALPGILAGATLAFARALGEFGATVVLAGNVEGSTRTIALAVYTLLEAPSGSRVTWLLVGASVALSLLALLGFESLSRRQRRRLSDDHVR